MRHNLSNLVILRFSSSLHHLVSKNGTERQKKYGLLFFTSVVCSPHVSLIHQMQTEAQPFSSVALYYHPMKTGAKVLLNYIATVDYLFTSYFSPHCINFLLTNWMLLSRELVKKAPPFYNLNIIELHRGTCICIVPHSVVIDWEKWTFMFGPVLRSPEDLGPFAKCELELNIGCSSFSPPLLNWWSSG